MLVVGFSCAIFIILKKNASIQQKNFCLDDAVKLTKVAASSRHDAPIFKHTHAQLANYSEFTSGSSCNLKLSNKSRGSATLIFKITACHIQVTITKEQMNIE